jgi:hypothetical protein
LKRSDIYVGALPFVHEIDRVYQTFLPQQYSRQMEYVRTVPEQWKIAGTAFTTLYVLRNCPTALHVDKLDLPESFGVMSTLGDFRGGEICFPKYRVAVDYRPGDVLLADVHELHGNFPVTSGERVSCVLFVRQGIHECPGV